MGSLVEPYYKNWPGLVALDSLCYLQHMTEPCSVEYVVFVRCGSLLAPMVGVERLLVVEAGRGKDWDSIH
jgi:hypothetical protein